MLTFHRCRVYPSKRTHKDQVFRPPTRSQRAHCRHLHTRNSTNVQPQTNIEP